jgi:hypothetical protein
MHIHLYIRRKRFWPLAGLCLASCATTVMAQAPSSQEPSPLAQILERLERLEQQNRQLVDEVHALRSEMAVSRGRPDTAAPAELAEKLEVQEHRIEELAQTKVESSQHLPVRITGMALFNAFLNSHPNGKLVTPVIAPLNGGARTGGATFRQTILGLEFRGPETFANGKVRGYLNMDFFGGSGDPYDSLIRLRTAAIQVDWKSTTVMFGQEKPLIAPREPNSLAQLGISPLTGAGNLWLWQPQARIEQRFQAGQRTTFRAQLGVVATREDYGYVPEEYARSLQSTRPALEGRFALSHTVDDERRIEIGAGFHTSTSYVAGFSVPSRAFAVDWFANPWRKLEFSGTFFRGSNVTNIGAIGQGFTVMSAEQIIPVHTGGGWAQLSILATPRLSFNLFGGLQDNRARDMGTFGIGTNQAYAVNLMYRLASNVILSLETGQIRTGYLGSGDRLNNHHDLGFAYLF